MTKSQAKKCVRELLKNANKIDDLIAEMIDNISSLMDEMREEADSIEPYENNYYLTEQQEERVEWLNDNADNLENLNDDAVEQMHDNILSIIEELENILDA